MQGQPVGGKVGVNIHSSDHLIHLLWTTPGHTVSGDTSDCVRNGREELHASHHGVADEVHCMQLRCSETFRRWLRC